MITPHEFSANLQEAYDKDSTVNYLVRRGCSLDEVILVLIRQKDSLLKKTIQLDALTPKRYRKPDGTLFEVYPPKDLIPITDLQC
jgi:hypothetical protein